jgi:hypothetical protein
MSYIKCGKMPTLLLILFLTVAALYAGENDNQNLTLQVKPAVDFSGYTESELDSLAYYCMGRGFNTFNGYSKIEEKLYKFDIHPQTPNVGIATGYAILYGHYVKPPYKFEIGNDTILYLNGVQIDPEIKNKVREIARAWYSKRAEKEAEKDGLNPYMDEVEFLLNKADSIYKALISTKGQKRVIDTITKLFKSDTFLYRFEIGPQEHDVIAGTLVVKSPVDKTLINIGFTLEPYHPNEWSFLNPKDEAERIRWRKELLERDIKSNEENLKMDGTQFGGGGRYGAYWAITTYQIMSDPSLNLFMKVDKLKRIDPTSLFFKEIIYNYTQAEYQEIEKRGQK